MNDNIMLIMCLKKNIKRLASFIFFATFFSIFLISCGKEKDERIILNDSFYWYETDEQSEIWDAMTNVSSYKKLDDTKNLNLTKLIDGRKTYIWLKSEFKIPDELKNQNLALEIPYVHFSAETYINGILIGKAGEFPPDEMSAFYSAQYYDIRNELVNPVGTNTIYIKVFCQGKSTFAGKIFIGKPEDVKKFSDTITFFRSTIYIFFSGILFGVFILFFVLFMTRREIKEYFSLAMMNFFTIFFLIPFFAGTAPVYKIFSEINFSYTLFTKIFLCINTYIIINFYVYFMFHFLKLKESLKSQIIRNSTLVLVSLVTLVLPNYEMLQKSAPFIIAYCLFNSFYGIKEIIKNLFNPKKQHDALILIYGLLPMMVTSIVDLILHFAVRTVYFPFFAIFGWFIVNLVLIGILTYRYSCTSIQNAYLNRKLKEEVAMQTKNLTIANERLAKEINRAQTDLEMASIVQKKYFPQPRRTFKGWDLAIDYQPLSNVSGDLYDYYFKDNNLRGIAIFDVSGHGLSASLITMLAKNIINNSFETGEKYDRTVSETLLSINRKITSEKGDIDNYLTGILIKIGCFNKDDRCHIEMANAGHPYPLLYKKAEDDVIFLKHGKDQKQFGAIGIQGIDVSFPAINFEMNQGDILVCYTDGLYEINNVNGEQFGFERIGGIVKDNCNKSPNEIISAIKEEIEAFANGVPRDDDITLIVLKRKNSKEFSDVTEQVEIQYDDLEEL